MSDLVVMRVITALFLGSCKQQGGEIVALFTSFVQSFGGSQGDPFGGFSRRSARGILRGDILVRGIF